MPPAIQPLTTADVRGAVKNSKEADFLVGWLEERNDAALFVGSVTKVANNKPRLLVITSYRAAIFGFSQFQTRKSYEFELIKLLAIQVERDRHRQCHRHRHTAVTNTATTATATTSLASAALTFSSVWIARPHHQHHPHLPHCHHRHHRRPHHPPDAPGGA